MMNEATKQAASKLTLPPSVVRKVDLAQLVREVERVDNELTTRDVHQRVGATVTELPRRSQQLTDFLQVNQLQLADSVQRSQLIAQLRELKRTAPIVHLTFATEADEESLQELTGWVRTSVHPQAVVTVGLQPGLIGGVYVRTRNHVHDLSVRAQLAGGHDLIIQELEALSGGR